MGQILGVRAPLDVRRTATGHWNAAAAAVACTAVVALALLPILDRAPTLQAPALGATLQTAVTCGALAAGCLMYARFADSRRLRDLLVIAAVSTLGLMNLAGHVLPAVFTLGTPSSLSAIQLWGQLILAGVFAAASFTSGERLVSRPRRLAMVVIGASLAATLLATFAGLELGPALLGRGASTMSSLRGHAAFALSIVAIALLGSSALRLASRDDGGAPGAAGAVLATASVLLAAAGLYQLVEGSPPPGTVSPLQLPGVCAFVLILVAATRHEPRARARVAHAAALAERRRVAQDLHDGLAQDLAFIVAHGPALSRELGEDHPLVIAAQRALTISRSTISGLCDPAVATAAQSLEAVAQELRDQFDVAIAVNAAADLDVAPRAREHVSRIAREAIANAVRHGGARNVSVSLSRLEQAIVLRVVDDGCGLEDPGGRTAPEGFGISGMRERAAALGGFLTVRGSRRGGTELEVVFR